MSQAGRFVYVFALGLWIGIAMMAADAVGTAAENFWGRTLTQVGFAGGVVAIVAIRDFIIRRDDHKREKASWQKLNRM